jgi:hypothetical protein
MTPGLACLLQAMSARCQAEPVKSGIHSFLYTLPAQDQPHPMGAVRDIQADPYAAPRQFSV